jgi:hypothetical protein
MERQRRGSAARVAGRPRGCLQHPPGQGKAGSVCGDQVNPGVKIRPRRPICQRVTSPIPLILKSTPPPPATRNAVGGRSEPWMSATCSPRSTICWPAHPIPRNTRASPVVNGLLDRQLAVHGGAFWDAWPQVALQAIDRLVEARLQGED